MAKKRDQWAREIEVDLLTQDEVMLLSISVMQGMTEGFSEEDVEVVVAWANQVRVAAGLLENILAGTVIIRVTKGQPQFRPATKEEVEHQQFVLQKIAKAKESK